MASLITFGFYPFPHHELRVYMLLTELIRFGCLIDFNAVRYKYLTEYDEWSDTGETIFLTSSSEADMIREVVNAMPVVVTFRRHTIFFDLHLLATTNRPFVGITIYEYHLRDKTITFIRDFRSFCHSMGEKLNAQFVIQACEAGDLQKEFLYDHQLGEYVICDDGVIGLRELWIASGTGPLPCNYTVRHLSEECHGYTPLALMK